ncbi:hypothetical protein [Limosilactobacillus pontis]|uniref:hypothetical protein n=1 Tax=Limosilactobacillus pontis TaxID=35787 RepID=UPI00241E6F17|nr:hypothetical protein [Limosilactobacillus pontis]
MAAIYRDYAIHATTKRPGEKSISGKSEQKIILTKNNSIFTPGYAIPQVSEPPTLIFTKFHFCQIANFFQYKLINIAISLFIVLIPKRSDWGP